MSDVIEVEGKIIAVLPGTTFRAELKNGHQVLASISGKLRKHFIKIGVGDTVKMEMNKYDLTKARITYRLKNPSERTFTSSTPTKNSSKKGQKPQMNESD